MKPFLILIITFILSLAAYKIFTGAGNTAVAGCIAMAVMLLFTGIAHFAKPKEMEHMLPPVVPARIFLILVTGIFEIAAAIGLMIPQTRMLTGWSLIVFFLLILPANIYAAVAPKTKTDFTGQGLKYLWFRVPLQLFFIIWVYIFAVAS
ncbi:DoxX family protein [Niabella soli]|uniref:Membrane protein n=1 Tax=Niabella soli DSM 19437 TaxID=929713 RepID=W0EXY8_9BACT|nr:DoxX family protein [Niabella soli]AHF14069.1 membrane protein [Niabella soli DSM 19437]